MVEPKQPVVPEQPTTEVIVPTSAQSSPQYWSPWNPPPTTAGGWPDLPAYLGIRDPNRLAPQFRPRRYEQSQLTTESQAERSVPQPQRRLTSVPTTTARRGTAPVSKSLGRLTPTQSTQLQRASKQTEPAELVGPVEGEGGIAEDLGEVWERIKHTAEAVAPGWERTGRAIAGEAGAKVGEVLGTAAGGFMGLLGEVLKTPPQVVEDIFGAKRGTITEPFFKVLNQPAMLAEQAIGSAFLMTMPEQERKALAEYERYREQAIQLEQSGRTNTPEYRQAVENAQRAKRVYDAMPALRLNLEGLARPFQMTAEERAAAWEAARAGAYTGMNLPAAAYERIRAGEPVEQVVYDVAQYQDVSKEFLGQSLLDPLWAGGALLKGVQRGYRAADAWLAMERPSKLIAVVGEAPEALKAAAAEEWAKMVGRYATHPFDLRNPTPESMRARFLDLTNRVLTQVMADAPDDAARAARLRDFAADPVRFAKTHNMTVAQSEAGIHAATFLDRFLRENKGGVEAILKEAAAEAAKRGWDKPEFTANRYDLYAERLLEGTYKVAQEFIPDFPSFLDPVTKRVLKVRAPLDRFLASAFMGTSPAYTARNALNNLVTGLVDGFTPFDSIDEMNKVVARMGFRPVAALHGLGPIGKPVKESIFNFFLANKKVGAQAVERAFSMKYTTRAFINAYQDLYTPRAIKYLDEAAQMGFSPETMRQLRLAVLGALNESELKTRITSVLGGRHYGGSLTPEDYQALARLHPGLAVAFDDLVHNSATPEELARNVEEQILARINEWKGAKVARPSETLAPKQGTTQAEMLARAKAAGWSDAQFVEFYRSEQYQAVRDSIRKAEEAVSALRAEMINRHPDMAEQLRTLEGNAHIARTKLYDAYYSRGPGRAAEFPATAQAIVKVYQDALAAMQRLVGETPRTASGAPIPAGMSPEMADYMAGGLEENPVIARMRAREGGQPLPQEGVAPPEGTFVEPVPTPDVQTLREQLRVNFNLSEEQSVAAAAIADSTYQHLLRISPQKAEQFWESLRVGRLGAEKEGLAQAAKYAPESPFLTPAETRLAWDTGVEPLARADRPDIAAVSDPDIVRSQLVLTDPRYRGRVMYHVSPRYKDVMRSGKLLGAAGGGLGGGATPGISFTSSYFYAGNIAREMQRLLWMQQPHPLAEVLEALERFAKRDAAGVYQPYENIAPIVEDIKAQLQAGEITPTRAYRTYLRRRNEGLGQDVYVDPVFLDWLPDVPPSEVGIIAVPYKRRAAPGSDVFQAELRYSGRVLNLPRRARIAPSQPRITLEQLETDKAAMLKRWDSLTDDQRRTFYVTSSEAERYLRDLEIAAERGIGRAERLAAFHTRDPLVVGGMTPDGKTMQQAPNTVSAYWIAPDGTLVGAMWAVDVLYYMNLIPDKYRSTIPGIVATRILLKDGWLRVKSIRELLAGPLVEDNMRTAMAWADMARRQWQVQNTIVQSAEGSARLSRDIQISYGIERAPEAFAFALRQGPAKGDFLRRGAERIIRGSTAADFSTAVHELVHADIDAWIEAVREADIDDPNLNLWEETIKGLGGSIQEGHIWSEDAHEIAARQVERYLRDGVAPSPELRNVFRRIVQWMRTIYAHIRGTPLERRAAQSELRRVLAERYGEPMARALQQYDATGHTTPVAAGADDVAIADDMAQLVRQVTQNTVNNWQEAPTKVAMTPAQAAWLPGWANRIARDMNTAKSAAAKIATEARNFALLDYSDRRAVDSLLALFFIYPYWSTRTYPNWVKRAAINPGVLAAYLRFQNAVRQGNKDAPDWLKEQIKIRVPGLPNVLWVNVRAMVDPMYQLFSTFEEPAREETALGQLIAGADYTGLSVHPIFNYIYAAERLLAHRPETARAALGHLSASTRFLRYLTGRLGINDGVGFVPEPWLWRGGIGIGGDKWEMNRVARELANMEKAGEITPEEARQAAYDMSQGNYDNTIIRKAMAREIDKRFLPTLMAYTFGPVRIVAPEDAEIDKANQEWADLFQARPNMSEQEYQERVRQFYHRYPFMSVIRLARADKERGDTAYVWDVLNRIPPGQDKDILAELGVKADVLNAFKGADEGKEPGSEYAGNNFVDASGKPIMRETDRARLLAAILDLAAQYNVPSQHMSMQWAEVKQRYADMYAYADRKFPGARELQERYYAIKARDPEAAKDFLEATPIIKARWQWIDNYKRHDPLLMWFYGDSPREQAISFLWDTYWAIPKGQRSAFMRNFGSDFANNFLSQKYDRISDAELFNVVTLLGGTLYRTAPPGEQTVAPPDIVVRSPEQMQWPTAATLLERLSQSAP